MTRKSIATNMAVVSCDVCGRTLLRGEHADVFLHQGARRMVCELCTSRAVHEGWLREGLGELGGARASERGGAARSLLNRLRPRKGAPAEVPGFTAPPPPSVERVRSSRGRSTQPPVPAQPEPEQEHYEDDEPYVERETWAAPPQPYGQEPAGYEDEAYEPEPVPVAHAPVHPVSPPAPTRDRDRRDVHAVPTNAELKVGRALEVFNASPHPRTVAGVARSLGAPIVSARPSQTEGAIVTIVVGWELSWYRYEVNLGNEAAGVRVSAQGSELSELDPVDQVPNAAADEQGVLHLVASVA